MYPDPHHGMRRKLERHGLRLVRARGEWQLRDGDRIVARAPELQKLKQIPSLSEILRSP